MDSNRLDLAEARRRVRAGSFDTGALSSWLSTTRQDPERFRDELLAYCSDERRGMLKSRRPDGYDIYHDVVLAHADRQRRALVWKDARGLTSLSFEQAHDRASKIAAAWAARGVEPGASVCIVQAPGGEWLLAILAALQLGLVVSMLSPAGPALTRRRLADLAPDYVVMPEALARKLGTFPGELLSTAPVPMSRPLPGSHTYGDEEPLFRLLSPFGDCVTTVPVGLAHHSLLRDGQLVFGLDASEAVAAPGWDALQIQPFFFLMTLFAGATWVELAIEDLEADPNIVERLGISLLGLGASARDCFLRGDIPPPRRSWFCNLTDVLDFDAWSALAERMSRSKVSGFGVVTNAASAGTLLFGLPASSFSLTVWPVPGLSLDLEEIGAHGPLLAHGHVGRFSPTLPDSILPAVPSVILSRRDDAFLLAGSLEVDPHSQSYPTETVLEVVKASRSDIRHADVVLTKGRWPNEAKSTLLLYLAPATDDTSRPRLDLGALRKLIAEQVGWRWVPDRIEVYALEPRTIAGEIDREHCRSQYSSGMLALKARTEVFVLLSRLRQIFAAPKQTD